MKPAQIAEILCGLKNSSFADVMSDYNHDMQKEWGHDVAKFWSIDSIITALTTPGYEGTDEVATMLDSIGNDSTLNDHLTDLTLGELNVRKVAVSIFRTYYGT
jgi:hypothetical protein